MESKYEINDCIKWIKTNDFSKIALQFSRQDLVDSPAVVKLLTDTMNDTSCEFFVVLTASCGVDFLGPLRLGNNFIQGIICFGSARGSPCFNPEDTFAELPVLFVFGRKEMKESIEQIKEKCNENTLILYDLVDSCAVMSLLDQGFLSQEQVGKIIHERTKWSFTDSFQTRLVCQKSTVKHEMGRFSISKPIDSFDNIVWVGCCNDLFFRVNLVKEITVIEPNGTVSVVKPQKELMKRLALIERTKEAKTIGIIFTNILPRIDPIVDRIQRLITSKKKEYILISLIQAVDNSKFGNFGEVDVFVLVSACSCGSFINDTKAHVPLIVLPELELALGAMTTYGGVEWNTDHEMEEQEEDSKATTVSSLMEYKANLKNHWFGLEVNAGESPVVSGIKEGATGVASGYDNEPF